MEQNPVAFKVESITGNQHVENCEAANPAIRFRLAPGIRKIAVQDGERVRSCKVGQNLLLQADGKPDRLTVKRTSIEG